MTLILFPFGLLKSVRFNSQKIAQQNNHVHQTSTTVTITCISHFSIQTINRSFKGNLLLLNSLLLILLIIPYSLLKNSLIIFFYNVSFRFTKSYGPRDFPVSLKLRQQMFVQGKVDSNDKRLSIMAEECFATPTPADNDLKRHQIISDGWDNDNSVRLSYLLLPIYENCIEKENKHSNNFHSGFKITRDLGKHIFLK